MVKGESKSPKRSSSKSKADGSASSTTRNSRQKLSESFPEVGRRIKVYKNGEPYDQGITFVLNMKKTHDIGTFLDLVTSRIGLVQGAKRLYTLDGKLIKNTDQLVNGEYVASSGSFIPLPYGKKKVERESSSTSIRSIRSRTSSTNPSTRSKSIETVTKKKSAINGTAGNGSIVVGNGSSSNNIGGGTFGRSKSQTLPNGNAKIVTPVATRKTVVKKLASGGTATTTKKVTNVRGEGKAAAAAGKTKTTATTKVEKKVEKPKKQGKKKVKEVVKEEKGATVVEHVDGGRVAGAIAESEIINAKSRTPSPSPPPRSLPAVKSSPSPKKRTPSPKSPTESPRPKTTASRPVTAASKKSESEAEEKDEESDRESHHHNHHEEEEGDEEEKSESSEGRSVTASETEEEEDDDDHHHHNEMSESEGSGRPGTRASRVSRRASLKSNKSVKSHHESDHK